MAGRGVKLLAGAIGVLRLISPKSRYNANGAVANPARFPDEKKVPLEKQ